MKIEKLNRHDFARALANGQGKAFLHVKQYGDRGIEKEILYACLNCQVYDRQCNSGRGFWLSDIIANSGRTAYYAEKILNHLRQDLKPGNTLDQIVSIAADLFDSGYGEFKPVIEKLFESHRTDPDIYTLCAVMVDIFSYDGLERAICAMEANDAIDAWEKELLFSYACRNLDGENSLKKWVEERSEDNKQIDSFYRAVKQCQKTENLPPSKSPAKSKGPKTPSYRQALSIINNNNNESPLRKIYPLRRFGKAATEAQLYKLISKLEQEQNPDKIIAYLTVFWDRPLPVVSDRVLSFLFSETKDLRRSARNALSMVKSNKIRRAAFQILDKGDDESIVSGISLLELNHRSSDKALLLARANEVKDIDHLHWVCKPLEAMAENSASADFAPLARWVFDNTPCGYCRKEALEILIKWGKATKRILFEAQWDAEDDMRILARKTFT